MDHSYSLGMYLICKINIISITMSSPLTLLFVQLVISMNSGVKNPVACTLPTSSLGWAECKDLSRKLCCYVLRILL